MLLLNFELELLEANLLCLSCWLHCVLKIRLSAYKSEYEHECLHFYVCIMFIFSCFLFLLMSKRGRDKWIDKGERQKGRIVDIEYECIYWEGAYDGMHILRGSIWCLLIFFYVCISLKGVFLFHLISVLSSSKKGRLLSPCLILMIPKHPCYEF